VIAAWAVASAAESCRILVDGVATDGLDCEGGGAWTVVCPAADGSSELRGKARVRVRAPALGIVAEARVPRADDGLLELPLSGPGGRAGAFVVDVPTLDLRPGQAVGPNQWCPVVQPGVAPGSERVRVPLVVEVTLHPQTGFAEQPLEGGVVSRVPVYGPGTLFASGQAEIVQRPVGTIPVFTGRDAIPLGQTVRGQLSLATPGGWRSIGWSGQIRDLPVGSGAVRALVVDFVAPEVQAAASGDPVTWLAADLERWAAGDDSALLGLAAWARAELPRPVALSFAGEVREGVSWRRAVGEAVEVRVGRAGDRLRVLVASRATPLDAPALSAIDEAAAWEMVLPP
jgi:hypothetical protein